MLFVCNYASPSLIKSDVTTATFSMIGHVLGSEFGPQACGLLLCPVYSYGKHQLFLEEHALLKALSNSSCSVDTMFQLNFDIKSKTATLKSNNNQISITLFPSEDFDVQGTTLSLPHPTAPSSQGLAWPAANGLQWSDALACGQSVWVDVARLQPFQA